MTCEIKNTPAPRRACLLPPLPGPLASWWHSRPLNLGTLSHAVTICAALIRELSPTPARLRHVNAGPHPPTPARPSHPRQAPARPRSFGTSRADSLALLGFCLSRAHCTVSSVEARLTCPVPVSYVWEGGGRRCRVKTVPHTDLASYFEIKAGNGFSPSLSCWETLFLHWSLKHHIVGVVSVLGSPRKRTNYSSPSLVSYLLYPKRDLS